jgi:hypothetical protein
LNPKDLLERITSKGDLAVFLLSSVAGYVVDALAHIHGLGSPGAVGGVAGTAGLGAKKGLEALLDFREASQYSLTDPLPPPEHALPDTTVDKARVLLTGDGHDDLASRLMSDRRLERDGLLSTTEFRETFDEVIAEYRRRSLGPALYRAASESSRPD